MVRTVVLLTAAALLGGCAAFQERDPAEGFESLPPGLEQQVRIDTPFFAQTTNHCGPASLAGVLQWSGVEAEPEKLADDVYLPGRAGSLQLELLAAARRHGRIAYEIEPTVEALLREVEAGHPVLVLQNLALDWLPRWHYALVTGYDLGSGEITLHTGRNAYLSAPLHRFDASWRRAERWGAVILPPDRLPVTAQRGPMVRAVAALEKQHRWNAAESGYRAALKRWPDDAEAGIGLANVLYARKHREEAAAVLSRVVEVHPQRVEALNNLAHVLTELGRVEEARRHIDRALAAGGESMPQVRATAHRVTQLEQLRAGSVQ